MMNRNLYWIWLRLVLEGNINYMYTVYTAFGDIEAVFRGSREDYSKHFVPPVHISKLAEYAEPFVSIGNQTGEGWFLTGEMIELIHQGAENIVCAQPFACLPNHVVGKGVIKSLRLAFPDANIVAVDYDPGASEVNQLNRIKLMLSAAKEKIENS